MLVNLLVDFFIIQLYLFLLFVCAEIGFEDLLEAATVTPLNWQQSISSVQQCALQIVRSLLELHISKLIKG